MPSSLTDKSSSTYTVCVLSDLLQWFDAIDKDGNGQLTPMELQAALQLGHLNFSLATVAHIIRIHDKTGSGTISFDEFGKLHEFLTNVQQRWVVQAMPCSSLSGWLRSGAVAAGLCPAAPLQLWKCCGPNAAAAVTEYSQACMPAAMKSSFRTPAQSLHVSFVFCCVLLQF